MVKRVLIELQNYLRIVRRSRLLVVRKSTLSACPSAVISFQERRSLPSSSPSTPKRARETSHGSGRRHGPELSPPTANLVARLTETSRFARRVAEPWKSPCVSAKRQKEREEESLAPRPTFGWVVRFNLGAKLYLVEQPRINRNNFHIFFLISRLIVFKFSCEASWLYESFHLSICV